MVIAELPTPSLLLDRLRLESNIYGMNQRLSALGVTLRPHVKTSKSLEVARLHFDGEVGPITVSTLREAEYFAEGGFTDILYAIGIVPDKLDRVMSLLKRGVEMTLLIDDVEVARAVARVGAANGVCFRLLIEIDCDGQRAGVPPDDPALVDLARYLDEAAGTSFCGFLTHAGISYESRSAGEIVEAATAEREAVVTAAQRVSAIGLSSSIISVGSSPTASRAEDLTGVTEVRAGVFVFQDLFQLGLGVCKLEDLALSVLTTVIGHRRGDRQLIVDAGGLALSKDRSTATQPRDQGYGLICEATTGRWIEGLVVESVSQEHGIIVHSAGGMDLSRYPIGSKLRVLPNHACMTAAAHDRYQVVDPQGTVLATWPRCNGW